jgi:hypothetical protein
MCSCCALNDISSRLSLPEADYVDVYILCFFFLFLKKKSRRKLGLKSPGFRTEYFIFRKKGLIVPEKLFLYTLNLILAV